MPLPTAPRRVAFVCVVTVLVLASESSGSARQRGFDQIDGASPGSRTGLIVGRVLDSSGAPVPEAIVQMSLPKYIAELPTTPKGRVMADEEGRFFFSDLPAGEYYLRATKEGYAGGEYGQHRVNGSSGRLALTEGERRVDATLTLWKFGVIGGTVLDEAGEPVIGVSVKALARDVVAGRTKYGAIEYLVPTATTDDRGMFRLSQLIPGAYVIVVPSTQTTVPVALLNTVANDYPLRVEFSRAIIETAPLGQPRTMQFGDWALLTLNKVLIPPPASAAGRMEMYRTTYFPAATTAGAATTITVAAGEERTDLRIGLRPVPVATISGRLVTPDGSAPPPTSLRLVGEAAMDVGEEGFETVTGMSDASGRFTLIGVPPGEYTLKQATSLTSNGVRGLAGWWLAKHVTVATSDIPDLVVPVLPALRVEGRSEFPGSTATPPAVPMILNRTGMVFETPNGEPGRFVGQPSDRGDRIFATLAAGGQYIARPYEFGGWFVKSVLLEGKDVTDRVFDLQSDATNFVVTYTDRASKITGVVRYGRGAASATAIVLAFPVDPQRWTGYGTSPRNFKSEPTSRTGGYTFAGLPPGDYFLIAIDDTDANGWMDPKVLALLARQATQVSIVDVEPKTIDLTVKAIR